MAEENRMELGEGDDVCITRTRAGKYRIDGRSGNVVVLAESVVRKLIQFRSEAEKGQGIKALFPEPNDPPPPPDPKQFA